MSSSNLVFLLLIRYLFPSEIKFTTRTEILFQNMFQKTSMIGLLLHQRKTKLSEEMLTKEGDTNSTKTSFKSKRHSVILLIRATEHLLSLLRITVLILDITKIDSLNQSNQWFLSYQDHNNTFKSRCAHFLCLSIINLLLLPCILSSHDFRRIKSHLPKTSQNKGSSREMRSKENLKNSSVSSKGCFDERSEL